MPQEGHGKNSDDKTGEGTKLCSTWRDHRAGTGQSSIPSLLDPDSKFFSMCLLPHRVRAPWECHPRGSLEHLSRLGPLVPTEQKLGGEPACLSRTIALVLVLPQRVTDSLKEMRE